MRLIIAILFMLPIQSQTPQWKTAPQDPHRIEERLNEFDRASREIGRLKLRMDELEKRVKKLEGGQLEK